MLIEGKCDSGGGNNSATLTLAKEEIAAKYRTWSTTWQDIDFVDGVTANDLSKYGRFYVGLGSARGEPTSFFMYENIRSSLFSSSSTTVWFTTTLSAPSSNPPTANKGYIRYSSNKFQFRTDSGTISEYIRLYGITTKLVEE